MLADTIYDHLHGIHQMNVKELIEPPILVNSKDTITQVINQMEKSDAYDVFCVEGKSVLTTNLRSLLSSKNIIDMKEWT
jgi:hypothetical protein